MSAKLNFKKGLKANLAKATINPGTLYITTDEKLMYFDVSETERIRIGNFVRVPDMTTLGEITPFPDVLYFEEENGGLYVYDEADGSFTAINAGGGGSGSGEGDSNIAELELDIRSLNTKLTNEISRAKEAEEALAETITAQLAAADAMRYKGAIYNGDEIPTSDVECGDTYKVGATFVYNDEHFHVGDLLIAESDSEEDGTYTGTWSHISSGYEDDYDATLDVTQNTITLKNGVGESRGAITFVDEFDADEGGFKVSVTKQAGVNGDTAEVNVEFMWGSF